MQRLITWTLSALTLLIPLTFTLNNSELFEFPKFLLLLSGTLIITLAWALDSYQHKKLLIPPLNNIGYAVVAILLTQTLATLTSIHPYTSFWGYYSRFHQGLLTTICYSILYFGASLYLDKKSTQNLIKTSVYTSILVSLYAIAQRLGVDRNLWVQDVVNRPFSTLGQPNWLAAYLLPNLFLSLYLGHVKQLKSPTSFILPALIFIGLILSKSRSGLLAFALSYPIYWYLLYRQFSLSALRTEFVRHTSSLLILSLIIGTAFTPPLIRLLSRPAPITTSTQSSGTQLENGGTESGDIRKIVWTGALDLIKKYPLLGTGPETFAYTYYWTRPLSHNNTSEWDFLYNKAHNEYLNLAATTGLLGLLAYLYFHWAGLVKSWTLTPKTKKVNESELDQQRAFYPVLGATILSFAVTNFFGFSVIPVYFLTILVSALPLTLIRPTPHSPFVIRYSLFVIPLLLLYPLHLYLADTNYAKGKAYLDANQPLTALPYLQKAVKARPSEAMFHGSLGESYATLALAYGSSTQAEQLALSQKYTGLALTEIDATRSLNPHHLNYYKSRAKALLSLAALNPQYNQDAALELEKSRTLAPTDPKLAYNLGLVYTRTGDTVKAESNLRDAIRLKPNYQDPYYALTLLYEQSKNPSPIPSLLQDAQSHLATYSGLLKEKIDKYLPVLK